MLSQELLLKSVYMNPFAAAIGIEFTKLEEGHAIGRIKFDKIHENGYGSMHGGCSFALADTVAGYAALSYGNYVTTVNSSMNYLKPVEKTEYVYCDATVVRRGTTLIVVNAEIYNDQHKLLLIGTFTYFVLGPVTEEGEKQ